MISDGGLETGVAQLRTEFYNFKFFNSYIANIIYKLCAKI
jgi:hypothetical protein